MHRPRPIDAERAKLICRITDEVLALPAPRREQHLERCCDQDPDLRREVQELVDLRLAGGEGTRLLDEPEGVTATLFPLDPSLEDSPQYPEEIGGFRILETLGAGGMGRVFLAEQTEPVRRKVAVKLIHATLQGPHLQARFEAERNAMARLAHPNVAQLYEAGRSADGFPYFAMEYLPSAAPLTRFCDRVRLPLEERLRLFVRVCQGVQHAHQKGILHRDLKPSNVLVVEVEGRPVPKVIDFGLAKALDGLALSDASRLTGRWAVGTPEYMSPEARAAADDIDTRSDIYSLGIILYELLTGTKPHPPSSSTGEKRPPAPRPSTRISRLDPDTVVGLAKGRATRPQELVRQLRGDLDWIVLRAIADEPDRRYPSAAALAADVERHLADQPVEARPPTLGYLAGKLYRRHRGAVIAAATVLLALLGGLVARTQEAHRAQRALAESRELSGFLVELFEQADPTLSRQSSLTVRELVDRGVDSLGSKFRDQPRARARFLSLLGSVYQSLGLYDEAEPLLHEALEIQRATGGVSPEDLRATVFRVADWQLVNGQYAEAKQGFLEARELEEAASEPSPDRLVDILYALARCEKALKNRVGAESLLLEALDLLESVDQVRSMAAAKVHGSLGFHYFEERKYDEAEERMLLSQTIRRDLLGPEHPGQAVIQISLGSLYLQTRRLDDAARLFQQAIEIYEGALGERHSRLGDPLVNLAVVYRRQERYDEAEVLLRRALAIREESLGISHPDVAVTLLGLGNLFWAQDRYGEAAPFVERALAIHEETLEPGHSRIGFSAGNLGAAYWKLGRLDEAEPLLHRALEVWETAYGPDHPLLDGPRISLAGVYRDRGQLAEAEQIFEGILARAGDFEGVEDSNLQLARKEYAVLLRASGREERAEELENLASGSSG